MIDDRLMAIMVVVFCLGCMIGILIEQMFGEGK